MVESSLNHYTLIQSSDNEPHKIESV